MQQWEYTTKPSCNDSVLNLMGEAGWELCAISINRMTFKRPIGPNWKERCEAAEAYIKETPCDPDIYPDQIAAWMKWQDIKNKQ